jgi:hypothetical protein
MRKPIALLSVLPNCWFLDSHQTSPGGLPLHQARDAGAGTVLAGRRKKLGKEHVLFSM